MPDSKNQSELKRAILISRLSVLIFVMTTIYIFLDWILEIHVQSFIYMGFLTFSLVTYLLNRTGKTQTAKTVTLLAFNAMIYIVASSEPFETGFYLHLFAAGAVALTIYNFEDWPKSLFFAILSTGLGILVYLGDFSIIEERHFSPDQSKLFFIINSTVTALICIYSILLFSKLNHQAEKHLRENEKMMLEQNEQLVKANKELDRFVYSVSHDLRAPLSSISGLIQLIEKSTDTKETTQYLNLIKGRIVRLEEFIRDIIDFSRNARSEIRLENVDLKDLVHEIFESLKFINGAESMMLQDNLPTSAPLTIDRPRLQIVLFNLISNAIQYRNPHNKASYIRLSSKLQNDRLWLQIEDNGVGIDQLHQAKVFDMFYRASENSKGSGLGLYIVKETMEKLGGSIMLHSVLGEGTRFSLELPIQRN